MPDWQAYPSGITTGVNSLPDTVVDPSESIGVPGDAAATDVTAENSIFALLKGALVALGVPVGSGTGVVNAGPKIYGDLGATLGDGTDSAASDLSSAASAIALTKRVLAQAGL